ncbi:hypothetical protein WN943_029630 [Citrus x changshan-huyou]
MAFILEGFGHHTAYYAEILAAILAIESAADHEALSQLKQKTTVLAYQEEFERLSQMVEDVPKNVLVGSFVGRLKDEIPLRVKDSEASPSNSTPSTFKRLTPSEVKERKDRGLCYCYDGKYSPSHKSQSPQLFMMDDFHSKDDEEGSGQGAKHD